MTENKTSPAPKERGIEHADSSQIWLRYTLEEIVSQLRRLLPVSGCCFLVVDWERRQITSAAAWFASEQIREAFVPTLDRPYEPERPGLTEAAIEARRPLLVPDVKEWEPAGRLHQRLIERLGEETAALTWEWYERSSFIVSPVETAAGRILGVLVISSSPPQTALEEDDLRVVEAFARLSALALERTELLQQEAQRGREEISLHNAAQEITRLLEPEGVAQAIVDEAAKLVQADRVMLTRYYEAAAELRPVAQRGISGPVSRFRFKIGEGMIGRVAQTGKTYLSSEEESGKFLRWFVEGQRITSFVHVPIKLGPRLFGVLTVADGRKDWFDKTSVRVLEKLAAAAAGALANALAFEREHRLVHALASGFVPDPVPTLPGFEFGVVYAPADRGVRGGDFFGAWKLPTNAVAVLVGDVSGKGIEVAAQSAMVRFFIEARTWDSETPSEILRQSNDLLMRRLPDVSFVPTFLGVIRNGSIRYCNAGHPPPILVQRSGEQISLDSTSVPLAVDIESTFEDAVAEFRHGDLLFAATDGLLDARREGMYFGEDVLPEILEKQGRQMGGNELAHHVYGQLTGWASTRVEDDVVILTVKSMGVAPEPG